MVPPQNSSTTGPPVNDFVQNSPYQSDHRNKRPLRRHKRLKTHPGADKDGLLPEDIIKSSKVVIKSKEGHRKASTVSGQVTRGSQYHNMPMLQKLRETKLMAETAMKVGKNFGQIWFLKRSIDIFKNKSFVVRLCLGYLTGREAAR